MNHLKFQVSISLLATMLILLGPMHGQRKKFNPETARETLGSFIETDPELRLLVNDSF